MRRRTAGDSGRGYSGGRRLFPLQAGKKEKMSNSKKLNDLRSKLRNLRNPYTDPEVLKLMEQVRERRRPEIERLEREIEELQKSRPGPKPRWPEDTPPEVLKLCEKYWAGTEEYKKFRIHCWNEHAVWTGYPGGGYSDNSGWRPTPAAFYLLSRHEIQYHKPKRLALLEGRQSPKKLQSLLPQFE